MLRRASFLIIESMSWSEYCLTVDNGAFCEGDLFFESIWIKSSTKQSQAWRKNGNLYSTMALLHKDLKVRISHIYSNLSDNSGMWSA